MKERGKERAGRRRKGILEKGRESPPPPFYIPGSATVTDDNLKVMDSKVTVTDNFSSGGILNRSSPPKTTRS